jgi:large subunit ribosomal protein L3
MRIKYMSVNTIFATKLNMSQGWTKQGRRMAITRCSVGNMKVVAKHNLENEDYQIFEIGFGERKLKNMTKPLRTKVQKSGFSNGVLRLKGIRFAKDAEVKLGDEISLDQVLEAGDVVKVQGTSKGKGFAGAMKRWGFAGGPRTHGQSDRERAVGSIGAGTYPGHVWKGKKMPGHMGVETKTVRNLVVLHVDTESGEVLLNGPIPGHRNSIVNITKLGKKSNVELDLAASGIEVKAEKPATEAEKTEDKKAEETK